MTKCRAIAFLKPSGSLAKCGTGVFACAGGRSPSCRSSCTRLGGENARPTRLFLPLPACDRADHHDGFLARHYGFRQDGIWGLLRPVLGANEKAQERTALQG